MNWFEEWFDSPLYEKLYAYRNKDEAGELADLVEKLIPSSQYPNILDLGCGRGRHSIELAERGYQVTGLDLSKEAITKAIQIAKKKKLTNVHFQVGDMRRPLDKTFDSVLNLFTTFGYFLKDEENAKVIESVAKMLNRNSIFILDYLNAYKVRKDLVPEEDEKFREMDVHIKREIEKNMVYKKIRFSNDMLGEPIQYQERVKLYELDWFEKKFAKYGLGLKKIYGSYSGELFNKKDSPRLLMVAKKI